jgi:hypothetical protein
MARRALPESDTTRPNPGEPATIRSGAIDPRTIGRNLINGNDQLRFSWPYPDDIGFGDQAGGQRHDQARFRGTSNDRALDSFDSQVIMVRFGLMQASVDHMDARCATLCQE